MIGKQTKGTSFGGCVHYVLKEEKSKLLEAAGVEGTPEQIAEQFELQVLLLIIMRMMCPEMLWNRKMYRDFSILGICRT